MEISSDSLSLQAFFSQEIHLSQTAKFINSCKIMIITFLQIQTNKNKIDPFFSWKSRYKCTKMTKGRIHIFQFILTVCY